MVHVVPASMQQCDGASTSTRRISSVREADKKLPFTVVIFSTYNNHSVGNWCLGHVAWSSTKRHGVALASIRRWMRTVLGVDRKKLALAFHSPTFRTIPYSRQVMSRQRCIDADVTPWRCVDVDLTLHTHYEGPLDRCSTCTVSNGNVLFVDLL